MANINGWGRGTWSQGTWGEVLPVTLTSVGAITSALGTVTVKADANATAPTLAITSAIGSVTTVAKANVTPTTQVVTSSLGAPSVDAEANVTVSGLEIGRAHV